LKHLETVQALGEVDSSSPRHRNTDTAPSSSDREDRDEARASGCCRKMKNQEENMTFNMVFQGFSWKTIKKNTGRLKPKASKQLDPELREL
jgi:hypothetical protein